MLESILHIQEKYAVDDSIKSLETYAFQSISGTQLNSARQITRGIDNEDALQIECKLITENNAFTYLFGNIKYDLSGQEIGNVYQPCHATTTFGLAKYSSNFRGPGLNQCWLIDK